jgi:hypothetical protein
MIPVALGAVSGLYFFFRGFLLLQHKPPAFGGSAPQTQPAIATITTTFTSKGSDTLARASGSEVIRLSPVNGESSGMTPDTQQGRIAAALLKAGISNPATWSPGDQSTAAVRVADAPAKNENGSTNAMQALDFNASKVLKQTAGHPAFRISRGETNSASTFGWKPALMIWGGPVLALTCIYILVAHLGWL